MGLFPKCVVSAFMICHFTEEVLHYVPEARSRCYASSVDHTRNRSV